MVQKVVRQPSTLLKEQPQQKSCGTVHPHGIGLVHEDHTGGPNGQIGCALVRVIVGVGFEHAHHDKLGTQIAVSLFKGNLLRRLVRVAFWNEVSDVKLGHEIVTPTGMKGREYVRHVISSMCKDDRPSRMFVPIAHIVHLVVIHHPCIVGSTVLLYVRPCVLGWGRRGSSSSSRDWLLGISSFSHGDWLAGWLAGGVGLVAKGERNEGVCLSGLSRNQQQPINPFGKKDDST